MQRSFLHALIVSVVVGAIMGISALLSASFGPTEGRVFLSTLCVAGASILSLACAAVLERNRARELAAIGIGAALLGFGLLLIGIWAEIKDDALWRLAVTLIITASFCAHAGLLLMTPIVSRYKWIEPVTICATALLGLVLMYVLWADDIPENLERVTGILAILATAGSILAAVFHRMSRDEEPTEGGEITCPHCGEPLPPSLLSPD